MLENGRIVEQGTHAEMVRLNGRYAHLWRLQTDQVEPEEDIRGIGLSDETVMPPDELPPVIEEREAGQRDAEFLGETQEENPA